MPYERLPARLHQLIPSEKGQEIFRNVVNSQLKAGRSESVAFASAWGALGRAGYEKGPDGKYEKVEKSRDSTLQDKVDEYNEKYGAKHGKVSLGMLRDVYDRGIGAYRTNPSSVRPNVNSKEQWAFARVNSFLSAARGAKKINHDKDIHDKIKKSQPSESAVHVPSTDWERTRKEDTFKPPASARNNARRVLRWKEKYGDEVKGMTQVGWTRANQLASGENLSRETVARMSAFARHRKNAEINPKFKSTPWKDRGYVAYLGWGGETGISWANSVMDRLKKSVDLGPLAIKSGVSSNRVEYPSDIFSSADDDLGPCLAVFSLKADVTSVSKKAELLGTPFFCTDAGGDAESLLIVPLSKVSIPVEPSPDVVWNEVSGNFWGDEIVCLVRDGTPSSQVLDKMFGTNPNSSIRQFCLSSSGQDGYRATASNVISKMLHMLNVRGGDAEPITATYVGDTSIGKDKASPISDFCGISLEKIFIPRDGICGAFSHSPMAVLSHDSLIFKYFGDMRSPDFEKSGYSNTPHASSVEVKDFLLIISDTVGHDTCSTRGGNNSQVNKRQVDDDSFTTPAEATVRSMDLGLEGEIHVHERNGQAVYMPGENHEEYLERIREMAGIESDDSEPVKEGLLERAISAIIGAIMQQVPVNKSQKEATVLKVDDEQGLVYGWAYVSTEDGELLVDSQGDSIEPIEMEKMATNFMLNSRNAKVMHKGENVGQFVHSFPMTNDIMKAFDIYSDREGWIVAMKPDNEDVMKAYKSGDYTGFSIGGKAGDVEEYDAS